MKKILAITLFILVCSCSSTSNSTKSTTSSNKVVTSSEKDGSSYENAIVIKAKNEMEGVKKEYEILAKMFPNYKPKSQGLSSKNGKEYDRITIITSDGNEKVIYFDITNFFGKF